MSELTIVAKVITKQDSIDDVKRELLKLIEPTRAENGCIAYNLHHDNENPTVFIFYETWKNLACLESHMNSEHFKNYVNAVGGLIEKKVVHKMTRIA